MVRVARHALIFIAALAVMWAAGLVPRMMFRPGIMSGLTPWQVLTESIRPDLSLEGLLRGAPILGLVALVQWAVFRSHLKRPALVLLVGAAIVWSAFAWFWMWFVFYSDFGS